MRRSWYRIKEPQRGGNLSNGGKGEEWLYTRHVLSSIVDKNKGDNYVIISLVVPYVMASTNLAYHELLKMTIDLDLRHNIIAWKQRMKWVLAPPW